MGTLSRAPMGTQDQAPPSFLCPSLAHGSSLPLPQRWLLGMKRVADVPLGLGWIYFLRGIDLSPKKEHPKLIFRMLKWEG